MTPSFNQDGSCLVTSSPHGYQILNMDPFGGFYNGKFMLNGMLAVHWRLFITVQSLGHGRCQSLAVETPVHLVEMVSTSSSP